MLGFLWWSVFALAGVWAQHFLPGIDFLVPGLIVSLQEEHGPNTAWLALAFILLQEGMGSLFFGSVVVVYGILTLAFMMGRGLFDSQSTTLVVLLGLLIGLCHFILTLLVMRLEGMIVPVDRLLLESVAQAVLTPLLWYLAHSLFPKGMRHNERSV